jgi:hypothetical protein
MKPRFYPRLAIALCTLFMTTFFGAVLFAYNLRAAGKGKMAWPIVLCSLFWFPFIEKLTSTLFPQISLFPLIIANVLGAVILAYPLWYNLLDDIREYEKRSVLKPVLIFVGICAVLIGFQILASRNWAAG